MSKQPVNGADDWVRRPGMGFVWWCIPIGVAVAAGYFASSAQVSAMIWTGAFAWMGTGCILNARRCRRLHCYISGPVFFLGATALALLAAGIVPSSPHSLNNIVSISLAIALLSFVAEMIWRKYL